MRRHRTLRWKRIALLILFAGLPLLTGCQTLQNSRAWGQDAVVPLPTWKRIGKAALNAATDPLTLVPLAGAAVMSIDDWDHRASRWAIRETPVFGSNRTAQDWSNWLLATSHVGAVGSTFATPSGPDTGEWWGNKGRGLAIEAGGFLVAHGLVEIEKRVYQRERPDGSDSHSFSSGHSMSSFFAATLTSKNFDSIKMPQELRLGLQSGAYLVAAGTAWARVEAGKHFPTDVLVGAAIGHFLAAFFQDAFLGLPLDSRFGLDLGFSRKQVGFLISIDF